MTSKYKRTKSFFIEVLSDLLFRIFAFIPNIFSLMIKIIKHIFT